MSPSRTLDTRHERQHSIQQSQPPNSDIAQHENRATLQPDKSTMRRDSKIGIRGLFSRTKAGKTDKDVEDRNGSRHASIRASLVEFGNWPYRHASRSEVSLTSTTSFDTRPTLGSPFSPEMPPQAKPGWATTSSWTPPALFQVYPQAVKHATLPFCSASVETLARHSETKSNRFSQQSGSINSEMANDPNTKAKGDTLKKKQRLAGFRNSLEWSSRIFVLINSGYLLQYAAEGTYNRVPERVLQLTATSAAYASDLIPGKHWVLQVASVTDANGNTVMEPKSRRSMLSAKDNERVSNMLLVFENPESMDDWLAILRREIEFHGGKKKAPETGKEEVDDVNSGETQEQLSPRTTAQKCSHPTGIVTRDFSYTQENSLAEPTDYDYPVSPPRRFSAYAIGAASPTASMISSDGQRLDNLRDSSYSHRFSYMSSGQRTMITSAGSSPSCSPTRASFSSQGEDLPVFPSVPEVRLRPNAAAIASRRQSMQALISSFETPVEESSRPYAHSASDLIPENGQAIAFTVPNFSMPHTGARRSSLNASVPSSSSNLLQPVDYDRSKASRKTPPTALLTSRPLSIVIDQPSPGSPCSQNSLSRSADSCQSNSAKSQSAVVNLSGPPEQNTLDEVCLPRRPSQALSSESTRKSQAGDTRGQIIRGPRISISAAATGSRISGQRQRAASSLGSYGMQHKLSAPSNDLFNRRSSLANESYSSQNLPYSSANMDGWESTSVDQSNLSPKSSFSPKRSAPSLRTPLTSDSQDNLIPVRRSLPQLNEGPPLGPPPSCALPPIPQKP